MPLIGYREIDGTTWDSNWDFPDLGYYGSVRTAFGSFTRVYANVATFGTILNYTAGTGSGTTGTQFATIVADLVIGSKHSGSVFSGDRFVGVGTSAFTVAGIDYIQINQYGSVDSHWIVGGIVSGVVGTFGSIHNYPTYTLPATFSGDYIIGTRVRGGIGTFGSIHNYPIYSLPATVTADYFYGTHIRYGSIYGGYGSFGTVFATRFISNGTSSFEAIDVTSLTVTQYGSVDSNWIVEGRLYGGVGTFATIHNYPSYSLPATFSGDYIYGTRVSGDHATFSTVVALYGTSGTWRAQNIYGWRLGGNNIGAESGYYSFQLGALKYYGSTYYIGSSYGSFGTYDRLYAQAGTFGTIFNYPSYSLPATFGGDWITGTRIWAATYVGNLATLGYVALANGQFTVGTALTWVGNNLGFATRAGSVSYAATRMGSYINVEVAKATNIVRVVHNSVSNLATASGAVAGYTYFYEASADNILKNKVMVPIVKRKGDHYIQFYATFNAVILSTQFTIYGNVGTVANGSVYTSSTGGIFNYLYDISGFADGEILYARWQMRSTDAGDNGTLWNTEISILSS